jgi:hypothetical protein
MKREEVMAAIQQLKDIAGNLQCQIAALEELVVNENYQKETPDETPVVNEGAKELPAPPAEIHIDVVEEKPKATSKAKEAAPDEETVIACQILNKLPDFYKGTCRSITLQKQWHDNSDKINPKTQKNYDKIHINVYKVIVTAEDIEGKPLGSIVVHWNTLSKWHQFLRKRHIEEHDVTDNPHTNWMPKIVSLCID